MNTQNKPKIYLTRYSNKNGERHKLVIRIVNDCDSNHNLGSICLGPHKTAGRCKVYHLDLAHNSGGRYLIGEIQKAGGDFRDAPGHVGDGAVSVGSGRHTQHLKFPIQGDKSHSNPRGSSACWAGVIYESWRSYETLKDAIAYLERYFDVQYCEKECEKLACGDQKSEPERALLKKDKENTSKASVETFLGPPNEPSSYSAPHLPPGAGRKDILEQLVHRIQNDSFERRRRHGRNFYATGPKVYGWDNRIREYAYAKSRVSNFVDVFRWVTPITSELTTLRHRYVWAGKMAVVSAADDKLIRYYAEQICIWGGVKQSSYAAAWEVLRDSICEADHGSPMNSGWTKVASFATDGMHGNEQTIWDSRVSTSIIWRIDQILHASGMPAAAAQRLINAFDLGTIASISGTRPRPLHFKWRNGYSHWWAHFNGSSVVQEIVSILNNKANGYPRMPVPILDKNSKYLGESQQDWSVFGVGLVLFMDGW